MRKVREVVPVLSRNNMKQEEEKEVKIEDSFPKEEHCET